ncbi:MAG TPA: HNH endonuclease signature motif containing protein, partial [Acidimicrobiia bacterium]|nr:HNH endonuclease signature motif containing protein [Acidimicrobiia bacterium]
GCRMPAIDCDLDHRRPWADGGPTKTSNLAPLCRHNHNTKHRCGWTYQKLPNGDYLWTSRLGHTYTTSGHPP